MWIVQDKWLLKLQKNELFRLFLQNPFSTACGIRAAYISETRNPIFRVISVSNVC